MHATLISYPDRSSVVNLISCSTASRVRTVCRTICVAAAMAMSTFAMARGQASATAPKEAGLGNVIFMHPDGAAASTWAAARALYYGPDSDLNWDLLPAIAVYRGHMADSILATSNGGATTHATGLKVGSRAFGLSDGGARGELLVDEAGLPLSVAMQAMRAEVRVGLVQTGIASEPGTACFVTAVESRGDHEEIVAQLVYSGTDVMFSGGERYFLPEGFDGVHGPGERKDGRNLFDEARQLGYTVIRTRSELLTLPAGTKQVLGVFSWDATFNADTEEELMAAGKPNFDHAAPTVGEMTESALRILSGGDDRFLLVVEEEGTDNFGNVNNASGVLESARRADDAFGVAQRFLEDHPDTLILTAADSDGGGLRMRGIVVRPDGTSPIEVLPEVDKNGGPIDGIAGKGTAPFLSAPDRNGMRFPFGIVWASMSDVAGGVLVRADGLNSHRVRGSMDNTDLTRLMRLTLFGSEHSPEAAGLQTQARTQPWWNGVREE